MEQEIKMQIWKYILRYSVLVSLLQHYQICKDEEGKVVALHATK
jgi:hypothetical protein